MLEEFQSSHGLRVNAVSDLYNCDLPLEGLESRAIDRMSWVGRSGGKSGT